MEAWMDLVSLQAPYCQLNDSVHISGRIASHYNYHMAKYGRAGMWVWQQGYG